MTDIAQTPEEFLEDENTAEGEPVFDRQIASGLGRFDLSAYPENDIRREVAPFSTQDLPAHLQSYVTKNVTDQSKSQMAQGRLPLVPQDSLLLSYFWLFDEDERVVKLVKRFFTQIDERFFAALRLDTLNEHILYFLCRVSFEQSARLMKLLSEPLVSDRSRMMIAAQVTFPEVHAMLLDNQLRLLRAPGIIRSLAKNETVLRSELDRGIDFLVREGVFLDDVDAFADAFVRLGKADMLESVLRIKTTEDAHLPGSIEEVEKLAEVDSEAPVEEKKEKRKPLGRYPIPTQIKLGMIGDHAFAIEACKSNIRLVANAGISNARIRDGDIPRLAKDKSLHVDVIRAICMNGEWTKAYAVKLALLQNPKTPLTVAIRWLPLLRVSDLKTLAKSKQVPTQIQTQAKKLFEVRSR